ncbi:MAG: T9SS type A sorting domain-containing protein [bacterium]|nr:MAG: T9SS type A sorting domain-containing protein [bacterium]
MILRTASVTCILFLLTGDALTGTLIKTVEFEPPLFDRSAEGITIAVHGCRNIAHPGAPVLPVYTLSMLLPPGEVITDIRIQPEHTITLDGTFEIVPMAAQIPLGLGTAGKPLRDNAIYRSHQLYPPETGTLVAEERYAGLRIAFINIYPCRLTPASGKITFSPSVTVVIDTETLFSKGIRPPPLRAAHTARVLRRIVHNPETVDCIVPRETRSQQQTSPNDLFPYLIITSPALVTSFQPLADLKTFQGLRARIVDLDWIDTNLTGADTQEKIRNCIILAYETWQTEYVLLGGDDEIIPHRGFYTKVGNEIETDIISDLYYAALDGNWNTDGDAYFGEPGEEDLLPEVTVGRLPADSPIEVANFVSKLIAYSLTPVATQCPTALMAGELLWSIEGEDTWGGDYKDEILNGSTSHATTTEGIPAWFTCSTLYDRDRGTSWNASHLIPLLNSGHHLVNHIGHGNLYTCMRLTPADISFITNSGLDTTLFVCYSQGCYPASFDNRDDAGVVHPDDAIGEEFVVSPAGVVAFIGNTRLGWDSPGSTCGVSQFFDRQFFDAIFGEGITLIGEAFDDSRIDNIPLIPYAAVRYVMYGMCLLGDPAMHIWRDSPHTLTVTHDTIMVLGQNTLPVTVEGTSGPVEGARVSLYCDAQDIYCTSTTDILGHALLEPQSTEICQMLLSVQAPDHFLYTDTVSVVDSISAMLTLTFISLDDDSLGASLGDGDGVLENGETVEVSIAIGNVGTATAKEAEVVLTCLDPFVTISNNTCTIGDIPPRAYIIKDCAFTLALDSHVPNGRSIELELEFRALEGSWSEQHALNVVAPDLVLESWTVTDTIHGNGNGCLEGWEFHNINCTWRNNGSIDLVSPCVMISIPYGSWATIIKPAVQRSVIPMGGTLSTEGELEYFVHEFTPPFSDITIYLSLRGDNIPMLTETLTVTTCGTSLDDSVNAATPWSHAAYIGMDGWHITLERYLSPPQSWKCGNISPELYDNMMDAALISPPLCLHDNSVLTFWHYMDAEAGEIYPYWAQDAGVLEISTDDGETWQIVNPVGNYPCRASASNTIFLDPYQRCYSGQIEWEQAEFDLSSFHGPALIRFHFASNEQFGYEGWFIDDIRLTTEHPTDAGEDDTPRLHFVNVLAPAFPNPFNPVTTIPFEVAAPSPVQVRIYDVSGRLVTTLTDRLIDAGRHQVMWNGTDRHGRQVSSGVYFCRLTIGFYTATQRIVLVR